MMRRNVLAKYIMCKMVSKQRQYYYFFYNPVDKTHEK